MNLYIVRHGYAESGHPDSERKLRDFGREKLLESMPIWKSHIPKIDIILTSPLKRALETAEVIHKYYNVKENLIIDQALQPGINIPYLLVTLSALEKNDVMIVSHMPDVSDLVSDLVAPTSFGYPFSPGTLAFIEFKERIRSGGGKLKLLLSDRN